jgi:hypothetical protein
LPLAFPGLGFADPRTGFGEGGVDRPAGDGRDGVRPRLPGCGIGIGADVGLGGEVADGGVGEALAQRRRHQADRRRGQPVQAVVAEALGERAVAVAAAQQLAQRVVGVGEILRGTRGDAGEQAGVGIEGLAGGDTVAGGLLRCTWEARPRMPYVWVRL